MKKLFAMLLVGALVSVGCSSATSNKTTSHTTEATKSTEVKGAHPDTGTKMAPATTSTGKGSSTEVKKTTEAAGKATSKATEKK